MMMKFLLPLALFSGSLLAQSANEEAIILNQELQFLENSAKDIELRPVANANAEATAEPDSRELNLERTYFSDTERDEIRTKAAAPKRVRGF